MTNFATFLDVAKIFCQTCQIIWKKNVRNLTKPKISCKICKKFFQIYWILQMKNKLVKKCSRPYLNQSCISSWSLASLNLEPTKFKSSRALTNLFWVYLIFHDYTRVASNTTYFTTNKNFSLLTIFFKVEKSDLHIINNKMLETAGFNSL